MRRTIPEYIKQLAKEMRNHPTAAEQVLWSKIKNKQLGGYRFLRQYVINRYIADFYCNQANVVIEVDGKIHEHEEQKEYDRIREEVIKAYGIKVIRFNNNEIINYMPNTLKKLLNFLESGNDFQ